MATVRFHPWAQTALGRASKTVDEGRPLGASELEPQANVTGPVAAFAGPVKGPTLELLGPGGVTGIDPATVVRVDPPDGAVNVESNYMAVIELGVLELPWLLTPAHAGPSNRLRPWIALVVVNADARYQPAARPLPTIEAPVVQLQNLDDSWAWAHVQQPGGDVGRAVARLLCPRKLDENSSYRACLVPAFAGGRDAGLGQEDPKVTGNHAPAWPAPTGAPTVTLPVYYSWTFSTGEGGDFEDLMQRLEPAKESELDALAARLVDLSEPWPGRRPLAGTTGPATLPVPGALEVAGRRSEGTLGDEATLDLVRRLTKHLEAPADRLKAASATPPAAPPAPAPVDAPPVDPESADTRVNTIVSMAEAAAATGAPAAPDETGAVAPPIYGGRHADTDRVLPPPQWLAELNLDPTHRIAAAIGAQYVRENQEYLMARAWEQVGAIREANRKRAMAELATETSASLHERHVKPLAPGPTLALAAPASERIRAGGAPPVSIEVTASPLSDSLASTSFARFMRPGGPIASRSGTSHDSIISRGLRGEVSVPDPPALLPTPPPPEGEAVAAAPTLAREDATTASAEQTTRALDARRQLLLADAIAKAAEMNGHDVASTAVRARLDETGVSVEELAILDVARLTETLAPAMTAVDQAVTELAELTRTGLGAATQDQRVVDVHGVQIDAGDLNARLTDALAPGDRIERRLDTRVLAPESMRRTALQPLLAHPVFPAPMAYALLATAPDWFLPGIAAFPANRTTLLVPNARFIESYLVGLNHEMMSELLWREYPTDRRGTPFQSFWPRSEPDAPEITEWKAPLGDNLTLDDSAFTVLLVRGDVIRRYPDLIVAATRALAPPGGVGAPLLDENQSSWLPPLFQVQVDPSTVAYAFAIPPAEVEAPLVEGGPAGVFFVFQEHSHRTRFGFDVGNPTFSNWDELDWPRAAAGGGFALPGRRIADAPAPLGDRRWDEQADAANTALVALQKPYRVAIHSSRIVRRRQGG